MSKPRPIGWSLDTSSLLDDLSRMTKVISGSLDTVVVQETLPDVRSLVDESTSPRQLIGLALLADCLRIIATGTSDEPEAEVLDACLPLLAAIATQFRTLVPGYDTLPPVARPALTRDLLTRYRSDDGPLGYRHLATKWVGLQLCRQAAADGDDEVLDLYGRMAHRLFDDVLATAGPGIDRTERDELFRRIEEPSATTQAGIPDRRADIFVAHNIPVFSPVAHATPAAGRDPLDVEEVHREARDAFASILDRATGHVSDRGRMLLVIGDSGCGKTHLLRALRASVHARRRGHAALVQLHSRSDNYARYLMGALVESMEQEHDPPEDMRTGLLQLSNGLVALLPPDSQEDVARLRGGDGPEPLEDDEAVHLVEQLVDALARVPHFPSFDRDLLRVLLHEQRQDPRIHALVMRYLRCRDMSDLDRRLLGGIPPLTDPDDPQRTIVQLARLIRLTQDGALVFLLDQVEDQSTDSGYGSFGEAVNTVRRITEEAPSTAAVFACLDSFYEEARSRLDQSAIDRLERDPERQTLRVGRTLSEIEAIVARRLEHLYTSQGTEHLADEPTFPIPQRLLEELDNRRLRAVLDECRRYREACQAAGRLVDAIASSPSASETPAAHLAMEHLDLALNDERTNAAEPPTDAAALLAVLVDAMSLVTRELGVSIEAHEIDGPRLRITTTGRPPIVAGFTNKSPAGGGFRSDVQDLRTAAEEQAATAVAARLSEFPSGRVSTEVVQQLQAAGGRKVVVHLADLRMVAAVRALADKSPPDAFERWLTDRRPVSSMASIQTLLDIAEMVDQAAAVRDTAASTSNPPPAPQEQRDPEPDGQIRLGRLDSRSDQPCYLDVNRLTRHCAILGASGSGKTVAALNLVEQALEQGVPVVLVDRKGDLAGYADARWWAQPGHDEAATRRKQALERRLDIKLFTPGAPDGRQLGLPAVPAIDGLADYERDATIKHASAALTALARLSPTSPPASILEVAIGLLARAGTQPSLPDLIGLIEDRDPGLLAEAGRFDDRYFKKLVEALETIRLANRLVFTTHGEQLSAERLFRADRPDRVALSIVSTKFLGTYDVIQLWVSRLISEIARFASRAPADRLQAIVMFDEADTYLPAGSKPPTKDPMMDLLRRARSGGIGVLLASQSPGDFDYKAREQISTWLVGKVGANSIAKMRSLFEHRGGAVQAKLGQLRTGHFFEMTEQQVRPVAMDRALLETRQLSDAAIHDLARRQRSGR